LLGKFGISRLQAMRLAPESYVKAVDNTTMRKMLDVAAERQVPIMVFVGNRGCIQIHTGPVVKTMEAGPWYNVLDPDFNLHVKETAVAHTFVVKKPSEAGIVTSLEVFDANGEMIVQFFGKRKPGIPELEEWRKVINDLTQF
jgi:putative hemin transport protein